MKQETYITFFEKSCKKSTMFSLKNQHFDLFKLDFQRNMATISISVDIDFELKKFLIENKYSISRFPNLYISSTQGFFDTLNITSNIYFGPHITSFKPERILLIELDEPIDRQLSFVVWDTHKNNTLNVLIAKKRMYLQFKFKFQYIFYDT